MRRAASAARISFPTRTISSRPLAGERIAVSTPTFVAALDFTSGPVASFMATSYDVRATGTPRIEIYGSEGTLRVPDPNTFGGPVRLFQLSRDAWEDVPLDPGFDTNARGLGLADMTLALRRGDRMFRATGTLANHVLELMQACLDSSDAGRHIELQTTCARPAPLDPSTIPVHGAATP